jgi:hypothetical protein
VTTSMPIASATSAVLARLRSTGIPVGDARKPPAAGWQGAEGASPFATYLVLYGLNHARHGPDASIGDRGTDPQLRYQVTAVGVDRRAAETAADLAAARLTNGQPYDMPGRLVVAVIHDVSTGVTVDESVNPPLFVAVDRYRIDVSHP